MSGVLRAVDAEAEPDSSRRISEGEGDPVSQSREVVAASTTEVADALAKLGSLLLDEGTVETLLELLVVLARRTVEKADGVGVTLSESGHLTTASASDPDVEVIDGIQYECKEGPCVSSLAEGIAVSTVDVSKDERWPVFGSHAGAHGIAAMHSEPLIVRGRSVGALNVYSRTVGAFGDRQAKTLELYARQASIVLHNTDAFYSVEDTNRNLNEALQTRDMIGTAKGILMERESLSADDAFDLLTRLSQHSNRKLRDVAAELIRSHEGKLE